MATSVLPFIFDPEKGETAEGVARKRKVAEALAARIGQPQNVGQGLSAVGAAIGAILQSRRAAAGEEAGRAELGDPVSELERELLGGGSPSTGAPAAPPTAPGLGFTPPPSAGAGGAVPAGWSSGVPKVAAALASPPGGGDITNLYQPPASAGAGSAVPAGWSQGAPAPAAPAGVQATGFSGSKQDFIDMLMPAAVALSKKIGIEPSLIIAQAAQETGWGRHAPGGNYFGIKSHGMPGGQTLSTTEYANGLPHTENASFRTYSGPEASVAGYGDFLLKNSRYKPLLAAKGLDAQLAELGKSGYATDPNYARSVGDIARRIQVPTQVASLDPSIGLPTLPPDQPSAPPQPATLPSVPGMPTLPGGLKMEDIVGNLPSDAAASAASPGVQRVAAAMPPGGAPMGAPRAPLVPPMLGPGVSTVAGAMAQPPAGVPAQAPPPAAAAAAAPGPLTPQAISPAALVAAAKVLRSSFANAGERALAQDVIKRAMDARDPATQLALQKAQVDLENARNPRAETQVINGVLWERQKGGEWKAVTPPASPEWRDATSQEVEAMSLPPNTPLQINTRTGQKQIMSGASGLLSGTVDQDIVSSLADGVANGTIPPDMKSYYKYKVPVMAELQSRGTNLAELTTDWSATQRHFATLNNPQQTRIRQNIDTLQHTLPTIRQLATEWNAGGFPLLNKTTRELAMQGALGPEANRIVTLLGQQVADVVGEISSVLMGGNSPTDHAMELAAQNLSADWSYPTIIAALDQLDRNITFRRNAIENVSAAGVTDSKYNFGQGAAQPPLPPAPGATTPPPPAPGGATPPPFPGAPAATPPPSAAGSLPRGGYPDAGAAPPGFPGTADEWKYVDPRDRHLWQ